MRRAQLCGSAPPKRTRRALYKDDPKNPAAEPYINVIVGRTEDKTNPTYLKLVEIWKDPAVAAAHAETTKGTAVAVDRPGTELEQILDRVQQGIRTTE